MGYTRLETTTWWGRNEDGGLHPLWKGKKGGGPFIQKGKSIKKRRVAVPRVEKKKTRGGEKKGGNPRPEESQFFAALGDEASAKGKKRRGKKEFRGKGEEQKWVVRGGKALRLLKAESKTIVSGERGRHTENKKKFGSREEKKRGRKQGAHEREGYTSWFVKKRVPAAGGG